MNNLTRKNNNKTIIFFKTFKFNRTLSKSTNNQNVNNRFTKSIMERLKILRSYLSSPPPPPPSPPSPPSSESPPNSPTTDQPESPQPTMITTTNSTETTSPISTGTFGEDFTDLRRFNSRIQKSFNDSTKRITNLLQFRSISATKPSSPPSEMTVNHVNQMAIKNSGLNKGKQFLRSKSNVVESSSNGIKNGNKSHRKENGNDEKIEETEDSTNKHHNSPHNHNHHHHQHLSKKKVLSEDKISSDFIINTLNEDLDVLIAYFLADFNQNGGSVNYLETSDVCGAVYYQLALHTQKTLARVYKGFLFFFNLYFSIEDFMNNSDVI